MLGLVSHHVDRIARQIDALSHRDKPHQRQPELEGATQGSVLEEVRVRAPVRVPNQPVRSFNVLVRRLLPGRGPRRADR